MQTKYFKKVNGIVLVIILVVLSFGSTYAQAETLGINPTDNVLVTVDPSSSSPDSLNTSEVIESTSSNTTTPKELVDSKVDLSIIQTLTSEQNPKIGDSTNIWLDVSNNSPNDAHDIKVSYSFSPNLELVSSQGNGVFVNNKTSYYWAVGDLVSNTTKRINLSFRVIDKAETMLIAEIYTAKEQDIDSTPNNTNINEDDYSQISLDISSDSSDDGNVLGTSDQNTGSSNTQTNSNTQSQSATLPDTGLSKPLIYRLVTLILLALAIIRYYVSGSYFDHTKSKSSVNRFRPGY